MDVFIRNVPESCTGAEFERFLEPHLKALGITIFLTDKFKNKPCGIITLPDAQAGQRFLEVHGIPFGAGRGARASKPLSFHGRNVTCTKSTNPLDPFKIKCLQHRHESEPIQPVASVTAESSVLIDDKYAFRQLSCGFWDGVEGACKFVPAYEDRGQGGYLKLDSSGVIVEMSCGIILNIKFISIESIYRDSDKRAKPTDITFGLLYAPILLESRQVSGPDILSAVFGLNMSNGSNEKQYRRVQTLSAQHRLTTGHCFVYHLSMRTNEDLLRFERSLKQRQAAPGIDGFTTRLASPEDFETEMSSFLSVLRPSGQFGTLPFMVRFQLHKLAAYGFMRPVRVQLLSGFMQGIIDMTREFAVVDALRKLMGAMSYPGPDASLEIYDLAEIVERIKRLALKFIYAGSDFQHAHRHKNSIGLIHRVIVTPAGIYPESVMLETTNRVIRKYLTHSNRFIRVTFADEDFERLNNDRDVDRSRIFDHFRGTMNSGLRVGGEVFNFLGFSHSSLRSSQCWFMCPFKHDEQVTNPVNIIAELGNFSDIKSPAKCAARIGQAFSDTSHAVTLMPTDVVEVPDIERNDRVFSDGVGTISLALLQDIWRGLSKKKDNRASILQIRFQGAKGVVALDSRLAGRQICLRPSMIKFKGSTDFNLEICSAAYRPLPMFLNRSLIKVLEDLGVPTSNFLELQSMALQDLRAMTNSPAKACHFLETNHFNSATQVPFLIQLLDERGYDFRRDKFLSDIVDMAAAVKLRDMKYKGRIPVPQAYNLFGIMDETDFLSENQVYVAIREKNSARKVLTCKALVTRSPALHPGDVQIVQCVDAPEQSPLNDLHNCIVFSQHGKRDMPSQLSGGDLDGDLFSVIVNKKLWPERIYTPADYTRPVAIDIKRTVATEDITEFFTKFMETDQLGIICDAHLILADHRPLGSMDSVCLSLAKMASTAVDYSKTGIPVDMNAFPRTRELRYRPDFMAKIPHLAMKAEESLDIAMQSGLSLGNTNGRDPRWYYKSDKALGHLYRAIDEKKFLADVDEKSQINALRRGKGHDVMQSVWKSVQREAQQMIWRHHIKVARKIRDVYEEKLFDTACAFSSHREPLSEKEVFAGYILGRHGGMLDKRTRERSVDMKEQMDRHVRYIMDWITYGDEAAQESTDDDLDGSQSHPNHSEEALPRSMACLHLALTEDGASFEGMRQIKSFKYIAAVVCLKQLKQYHG